jgi:hypothetical protein
MKFRYSIARYMPSLIRGEVLNIGAILEDERGYIAARFLSRFSHVRAIYPDADLATLKLIAAHFSRQYPAPRAQGLLFAEGTGSLDELVRAHQNVLSLTEPRVTLGESLTDEVENVYTRFVAPLTSLAPKPISSVQIAPAQLKNRLESWLTKRLLFGSSAYQRDIEVPGTVYPWTFDFGIRNGRTTLLQPVSLKVSLDVAMNRVALVGARIADAKQASAGIFEVVAVPDATDVRPEPVEYLREHDIEVIGLKDTDALVDRLQRPLLGYPALSAVGATT